MKKNYFLLYTMFFIVGVIGAQVNQPPPTWKQSNNPYSQKKKAIYNKAVNCIDSVRYPQSKLSGVPEIGAITYNASLYQGISQAFHLSTPATINGIGAYLLLDFDGISGNFSPVNAQIKVYDINAQNYPTTPIDSAMVQVMDVGFNEQVLMFSSPIAVSDSFAIAIEMDSTFNVGTDTIWYATNICGWNGSTCATADGNMEGLSCIYSPDWVSANGSGWFHNLTEVVWDIDYLMHPVIEIPITASYTTNTSSICPDDTIIFTNTSTNVTQGMFNMYNGTSNPLYTWSFDDGTGNYNLIDTSYSFSTPETYDVQLKANYYGYTTNCVDSFQQTITVNDTAEANFDWMETGVFEATFTDSSLNAMTYHWDFGDGDTSTTQNPNHLYLGTGTYYVCLTVTDSNGCSQNTYCDSVYIVITEIEDYQSAQEVSVYPIPAKKYFNVSIPSNYFGGEIVITDVVGKKLRVINIGNEEKVKVLTDEISSGIYFVSVDYLGERVYTQRIVIDK